MEKLKMHSCDVIEGNVQLIRELFPNCIIEEIDAEGKKHIAVDFELLKQELSNELISEGNEQYQINWPGKRESLLIANSPIAKTLRPDRKSSLNFDETKNILIEGDNLEALKLLQESYLGKIKMIYIDPPYNTGSDFIYEDDFSESSEEYLKRSNQKSETGAKLVANQDSNGRFHSDWLSMLYPRLKLARNLLREDGVIFISIDGGELANLIKICNEIFGERNNLGCFIWRKKEGGGMADAYFVTEHEYVVVFQRSEDFIWVDQEIAANEKEFRYEDQGGKYSLVKLAKWGNTARRIDRPTMYFPINDPDGKENFPIAPDGSEGRWRVGKERVQELLKNSLIEFQSKEGRWIPYEKIYFNPEKSKANKLRSILYNIGGTAAGTNELTELFGRKDVFDNPKPTNLFYTLAKFNTSGNDLILDFFAGSGTTAHAIFKLNADDGLNRRFILVQLDQNCDSKSEAYKMGFHKISDVCAERIRLAGKQINDAPEIFNDNVDVGFRYLKIDSTNLADVYYNPDAVTQDLLSDQADNVKADRTPEDLLFQVLLDWGVDLSLPIKNETIQGRDVYIVDENALVACFDNNGGIDEEFVKELAKQKPLRVVFRDAGFKSDGVKINVEQIFKLISPSTEVKCI